VQAAGYEVQGDVVILRAARSRARGGHVARGRGKGRHIIADPLRTTRLKPGDHLLMDAKSATVSRAAKSEVEDLTLEAVPDIGYEDIGGLGNQIDAIKYAVELPYLYADYYRSTGCSTEGRAALRTARLRQDQ